MINPIVFEVTMHPDGTVVIHENRDGHFYPVDRLAFDAMLAEADFMVKDAAENTFKSRLRQSVPPSSSAFSEKRKNDE